MLIKRDFNLSPVKDFFINVKSKLDSNLVATEQYNDKCILIGWVIEPLKR